MARLKNNYKTKQNKTGTGAAVRKTSSSDARRKTGKTSKINVKTNNNAARVRSAGSSRVKENIAKNDRRRKKTLNNAVPYKVIPLGGMKEIGKNCTLIECGDEILIIDCGFAFPEYEMFGIDIVIPDFTYLKENSSKIKGLIITHGHEDHIGGVPFLLRELNIPVYASPLAMGLIDHKLEEHGLTAEKHIIRAGDIFNVGSFRIEAIQTNHSIADSMAFSIRFPGGHIIHTGDFKIDYSPLDGKVIDLRRFAQLGDEGVDLLLCDSTNVMRQGYTPSEAVVRSSIDDIFNNTEQRIIIATFSSNVHRIKYFMEASMKHHRRIAVSGRSMENVLSLARELGYLDDIPESVFVKISDIRNIPDRNLTIITTGSQGEPMSALTRMAYDNHKSVKLKKNDVVVFSSSPIPGNEKVISQVVNQLYEKNVKVVLASAMDVHVSGHASSEELKLMHTIIRPKFFMPAHGEYRHLVEHARLAQSLGQQSDRTFILANGDALEICGSKASVTRAFTSGEDVLVDGLGIGDVGNAVLRERKNLSQSGLITVAVALNQNTGSLMAVPEMRTRGFVYAQEHQDLLDEALSIVYNTIGRCQTSGIRDEAGVTKAIKSDMKSYIYKTTGRYPVIIPIILYV